MTKPLKSYEEIKTELEYEINSLKEMRNNEKADLAILIDKKYELLKSINSMMTEEIELKEKIAELKKEVINHLPVVPAKPAKPAEYITPEQLEYLHMSLDEYPILASDLLKKFKIERLARLPKDEYNTIMTDIRARQKSLEKSPKSEW